MRFLRLFLALLGGSLVSSGVGDAALSKIHSVTDDELSQRSRRRRIGMIFQQLTHVAVQETVENYQKKEQEGN